MAPWTAGHDSVMVRFPAEEKFWQIDGICVNPASVICVTSLWKPKFVFGPRHANHELFLNNLDYRSFLSGDK